MMGGEIPPRGMEHNIIRNDLDAAAENRLLLRDRLLQMVIYKITIWGLVRA